MDELLSAITNLINTGGALADDALYLYFALQFAQAWAWPCALMVGLTGALRLFRLNLTTPSDKLLQFLSEGKTIQTVTWEGQNGYYTASPTMIKRMGFVRVPRPEVGK